MLCLNMTTGFTEGFVVRLLIMTTILRVTILLGRTPPIISSHKQKG